MCEASIVEYTAENEGYRCGYCHSSNTNYSHGMWAHSLTVDDYQDLIDRGWRRSGKYTYKPTLNRTCCPQYPIRCDITNFRLSKSQKKVIKRVNRYLNTGECSGPATANDDDRHVRDELPPSAISDRQKRSCGDQIQQTASLSLPTDASRLSQGLPPTEIGAAASACQKSEKSQKSPKPGVGLDPSKPRPIKAKLLRRERQQAKRLQSGAVDDQKQEKAKKNEPKSLEDYLNDVSENAVHKLEIKLVRSEPSKESYAVFRKYQMTIHNEPEWECSVRDFTSFLVDTPLCKTDDKRCKLPNGYGSFHQQYVLDGKIIAVGVIDILSRSVSSVYFYYDPEYTFLSLGTYSALREVAFIRELNRIEPQIAYYYLGFYIHSCPKMRYKGQYDPSYLCCPETYTWHALADCQPKLDVNKYSRFAAPGTGDEDVLRDINQVMCLHGGKAMPYAEYRSRDSAKSKKKGKRTDEDEVRQYACFVGAKCAKRILLHRT